MKQCAEGTVVGEIEKLVKQEHRIKKSEKLARRERSKAFKKLALKCVLFGVQRHFRGVLQITSYRRIM
jgi:hypothetical protein